MTRMTRKTRNAHAALAALALLAACGGKDGDGKAGAGSAGKGAGSASKAGVTGAGSAGEPSAGKPAGLGDVVVTFAGKPVAMQRAFVKRMDPDRYQIYLTSGPGSCAELLDNEFDVSDRIDVLLTVTPRLDVDGKQHLQITDVYEGAPTMVIAPGARAQIKGAAARGEPVEVTLDFTAAAREAAAQGLSISVRGSFTAEGCGARERDPAGAPRAQHPSQAAITIAYQRLELKGAIVTGARGARVPDVLLTTGVKDCSEFTPWAAVIVARIGGVWRATGTWLDRLARAAGTPTLAVSLGAAGRSDDGPTVQLALSGAGNLGGYAVALEGTIEAIDCRR